MNKIRTHSYCDHQYKPQTIYFKLLTLICTFLFSLQSLAEPPVAIGPEQIHLMRQLTAFSDDFSETQFYDLDNSITLLVNILGLNTPEDGNAELVFTIDESFSDALSISEDPDAPYLATLQLAREAKRLGLGNGRLKKGLRARLTGWPANDKNHASSILLVDEIELIRSGKKFSMHADNPKMVARKATGKTSQE